MATFDIDSNVFIKALTLNSQSSVLAISTAGKFVDKNISVQITAKNGSASTPATTIAQAPTIALTTATGAITATYSKSQLITPTVTEGWVSSGTAGTISTTGSASLTLPTAGISVSGRTVNITPGWISSTTGYSVSTVSMTSTNATVSGTNFYQAFLSVPTGWVSATTAARASFANSASSGITYLDISNTTGAPILVSEGYLYINKGYTDNVRISLAKLIPDEANITASDQMRSGFAAYDSDGHLITGNIPDKNSSDITEGTGNIIIPSGYYASTATVSLGTGAYSAGITLSAVTVTPSVNISSASTYGFTTSQPASGTYITVDPGADTPTYSATGSANITTAGYLSTGNKYAGATASVGVAAGTNYYAPVVTPTIGGNGLATTTNVNALSTTPVVSVQSTGTFATVGVNTYGVTTTRPVTGVDGTTYLSINGYGTVTTVGEAIGFSTVRRNTATYSNNAGVITTHTGAKLQNSELKSQTATVSITPSITSSFATLYIPVVTPSFNGCGLTVDSHTNAISTTPTVTLSATGTLVSATDYGVTTTQPSSGAYKTIDVYSNITNGSVQSKFQVTRNAGYFNTIAGVIQQYDDASIFSSTNTSATLNTNVPLKVTDNFNTLYIPVVNPRCQIGYTATSEVLSVTVVPAITVSPSGSFFSNTSNYGVTTTQPSGTDGSDYLTLDDHSVVSTTGIVYENIATSITHTWAGTYKGLVNLTTGTLASYNGAGYSKTSTVKVTPSIVDSFNTHYMPVVVPTFSGSTLTASTTNTISTNMSTTSSGSYYIQAVATTTASRAQTNYSNSGGAIKAHSGATAIAATSTNFYSTATRVYIPSATFSATWSGGSFSTTSTNTNITSSTTDSFNNGILISYATTATNISYYAKASKAGYIATATTAVSSSITGGSTSGIYYIQGVTVNKPASGEAKFSLTIPNGASDMITFVFHVDPSGNVVVDDSTDNAFS